jgi:hypothetical protein
MVNWSLILTRFLPQISLRNLRKLDCYANRYPLRLKMLWSRTQATSSRVSATADAG